MSKPIKVLLVEDSEDDVRLALQVLQRAGFDAQHERVQSAEAMRAALARPGWDAIIADYRMPGFSGFDALSLFKASGLDIPFILFSGTIGEEAAVAAMKTGASDYVMKKNLARLAPALEREIKEAAMRSAHRQAQRDLAESEERFRSLVEQSIAGILILDQHRIAYANPRCHEIFGCAQADLAGHSALDFIEESSRASVAELIGQLTRGEIASARHEFRIVREDGVAVDIGAHAARSTYRDQPAIMSVLQDISDKKRAEERIQRYVIQLEKALMSTVGMATTLSGMRDPYTAGHERRVAAIAGAIGAEMGFDARRQEGLRVAGNLHDVGKITIPSEILSKPGKLSRTEFELIKGHPQAGYDVLKGVEFPWPVAEVALQHHERLDGSGYPQGLKGDAILLEARIMAVADVVEAMSSHRPYRPALGIQSAFAEIERGRGTAYEPAVVDACLKLFMEKAYAIPD